MPLADELPLDETAAMTPEEERQALETVIERLTEYFPDAERAELARVVEEEHHKMDGNPVREVGDRRPKSFNERASLGGALGGGPTD
jgi:hypothetical protein